MVIIVIIIIIIAVAAVYKRRSIPVRTYSEGKYYRMEEKKDYMRPSWLTHQYYELGISIQDIANDQNVSMITIRKWLDKLEKPISVKEELRPKTEVPTLKTEEAKTILPTSMEREKKSIKYCTNCGQQLPLTANFCVKCGIDVALK